MCFYESVSMCTKQDIFQIGKSNCKFKYMDKEIKLNTKGLEALMGKGLMNAEEMKQMQAFAGNKPSKSNGVEAGVKQKEEEEKKAKAQAEKMAAEKRAKEEAEAKAKAHTEKMAAEKRAKEEAEAKA